MLQMKGQHTLGACQQFLMLKRSLGLMISFSFLKVFAAGNRPETGRQVQKQDVGEFHTRNIPPLTTFLSILSIVATFTTSIKKIWIFSPAGWKNRPRLEN